MLDSSEQRPGFAGLLLKLYFSILCPVPPTPISPSLWLFLLCRYRGYFIPPRPEKNAVEGQRMADTFVEERRAALEHYMAALVAHPAIARSEVSWVVTDGELRVHVKGRGCTLCGGAVTGGVTPRSLPAPPTCLFAGAAPIPAGRRRAGRQPRLALSGPAAGGGGRAWRGGAGGGEVQECISGCAPLLVPPPPPQMLYEGSSSAETVVVWGPYV